MPDLDWNRKWDDMIAGFEPGVGEEHFGDQWGDPDVITALREVRRRFLRPYFRPGMAVLEIGSGGGRWTQFLLRAERLVIVEFNPAAFDYLRQRFPDTSFEFYQTSGCEIEGVESDSIDFVFTFDVFVHLDAPLILSYLREIERVLKVGGRAVVHYGDIDKPIARANKGFARMTRRRMEGLLAQTQLSTLDHDTDIMFHSNLVALEKAATSRELSGDSVDKPETDGEPGAKSAVAAKGTGGKNG